jgi:hypothetical protein
MGLHGGGLSVHRRSERRRRSKYTRASPLPIPTTQPSLVRSASHDADSAVNAMGTANRHMPRAGGAPVPRPGDCARHERQALSATHDRVRQQRGLRRVSPLDGGSSMSLDQRPRSPGSADSLMRPVWEEYAGIEYARLPLGHLAQFLDAGGEHRGPLRDISLVGYL